MQKQHKDLLRTLVRELRHRLVGSISPVDGRVERGDLDRELERLGIAPDGTIKPIDALPGALPHERYAYQVAAAQLSHLPLLKRQVVRDEIVERAAYTWINRLLALRAMEVRGLIDNTLRAEAVYGDISEKLYILRQSEPERASGEDGGWWIVLEEACEEQARSLPGLFALNDPNAALRPSSGILVQCATLVSGPIADFMPDVSDAAFADPDAIGWAYQFYQEESKALIDAKCKAGGKVVSRAEAAAKTQLFTEPYMVQWLLQNSLGRSYHEAYPQSTLPASWPYYVMPETLDTSAPFDLEHLTLLDPCVGSGHFLRAAFDMFVAMYREQHPTWSAQAIADQVLAHHLHGIDLDPRAAQLSALTLYLRAWELLRDERQSKQLHGPDRYIPPSMNLATTPTNLNTGVLERHLQRHEQDRLFLPLIEDTFAALEQASTLGSLLRPREYLDRAIAALQKQPAIQHNLFNTSDDEDLRLRIADMAKNDPQSLKQLAFQRITASFQAEAGNTDDISAMLFGREAIEGVRLLQMLDRQYAVVVTNPPYLGSKYMDTPMRKFVEKYYTAGKRDVYAAFILRCLELCKTGGRVAMVTMQSWMFLRSFAELRAVPQEKLAQYTREHKFTGLLRETRFDVLAQLGANAFEEIVGEVVQSAIFVFSNKTLIKDHKMIAFRLAGVKSPIEKASFLQKNEKEQHMSRKSIVVQENFISIPEAPVVYWLQQGFFELLRSSNHLEDIAEVRQGLSTANNERFIRCFWEIQDFGYISKINNIAIIGRWFWHVKGGRYQKWVGLVWLCLDWEHYGSRIYNTSASYLRSKNYYFLPGLTYTIMAQGSFAARIFNDAIFGDTGSSIFAKSNSNISSYSIMALTSARIVSYLLRITSQGLKFREGYVAKLPLSSNKHLNKLEIAGKSCTALKELLISQDPIEASYNATFIPAIEIIQAILHSFESLIEQEANSYYNITEEDIKTVFDETGIPAGFYSLIEAYDTIPALPQKFDFSFPQEFFAYLAQVNRIIPTPKELARLKSNLRALYEAGLDAKDVEQEEQHKSDGEEENVASGAYIPIPTETFLEALSVKMQLHPISVYWLLEELRAEGVRCKPEEKRLLEDRLSVLVLRLLGHRWPRQIEAGEAVPEWAEGRGAIPLVSVPGKATLAVRVRERLRVEDGPKGAQETEALLEELTGLGLEEWLRRSFFAKHISQFKHRPVVWHLASLPGKAHDNRNGKRKKGRGGAQRRPAFECFLYYHACTSNMLARIRNELVEPLIQLERGRIVSDRQEQQEREKDEQQGELFQLQETQDEAGDEHVHDETASAIASERLRELEAFVRRLREIEEQGFACDEVQRTLAEEPLDRWSGDGYFAPTNREELLRIEGEWRVDINDGVRVNIAPLQLGGVLVADVLKAADARKALADRARWRSDERRWVREGKLPRCGWMPEAVPASPRWDELEPQRQAEQRKLEQKRLLLQQGMLSDEGDGNEILEEEEEVLP